jgi:hypothetical protein
VNGLRFILKTNIPLNSPIWDWRGAAKGSSRL